MSTTTNNGRKRIYNDATLTPKVPSDVKLQQGSSLQRDLLFRYNTTLLNQSSLQFWLIVANAVTD